MARRVFFSFHFERDIWRVGRVRNSWLTKPDRISAGFWDAAKWEEVKKQGEDAIKRWINNFITGTSVTVVLIGYETASRPWVIYEIQESYRQGNGMLGIYIHNIKNNYGQTDLRGTNPFNNLHLTKNGQIVYLSQIYKTYDWVNDYGYQNLGEWVRQAAEDAGR
jgi:hypothetical protein